MLYLPSLAIVSLVSLVVMNLLSCGLGFFNLYALDTSLMPPVMIDFFLLGLGFPNFCVLSTFGFTP